MPNGWNAPLALMGCLLVWTWGVAPGWYETGLWPWVCAMPQSLNLVGIRGIFGTKDRRTLLLQLSRQVTFASVSANGAFLYQPGATPQVSRRKHQKG